MLSIPLYGTFECFFNGSGQVTQFLARLGVVDKHRVARDAHTFNWYSRLTTSDTRKSRIHKGRKQRNGVRNLSCWRSEVRDLRERVEQLLECHIAATEQIAFANFPVPSS